MAGFDRRVFPPSRATQVARTPDAREGRKRKMITAAVASKRGTKRYCQSEPCGLPFYDLNRDPIACPNCGEGFIPAPVVPTKASYSKRPQYKLFKPVETVEEPEEKLATAGDDELDATEDEAGNIEKADTLLEIDEDDDGSETIVTGSKEGDGD